MHIFLFSYLKMKLNPLPVISPGNPTSNMLSNLVSVIRKQLQNAQEK